MASKIWLLGKNLTDDLDQDLANLFFFLGQIVNILDFACHVFSAMTQLCQCSTKTVTDNTKRIGVVVSPENSI